MSYLKNSLYGLSLLLLASCQGNKFSTTNTVKTKPSINTGQKAIEAPNSENTSANTNIPSTESFHVPTHAVLEATTEAPKILEAPLLKDIKGEESASLEIKNQKSSTRKQNNTTACSEMAYRYSRHLSIYSRLFAYTKK